MEKLRENARPRLPDPDSEPETPRELNQGQAFALITQSIVAIAASMDTFAFLAEKWCLKNGVITEKDLEE